MLFLVTHCDTNLLPIVRLIRVILNYVTILVPIILIVLGTFDLLKAVTASKEDEIKAAQKLLVKRIVYAVLIFLIVPIISLIFGLFSASRLDQNPDVTYTTDWLICWREAR